VPNFKTHSNHAIVVGVFLSIGLIVFGFADINQFLTLVLLTWVGGITPDVDSKTSYPYQVLTVLISLLLTWFSLVFIGKLDYEKYYTCWIPAMVFIFTWYVSNKYLYLIFNHRGIIHSLPFVFLSFFTMYIFTGLKFAICFTSGVFYHLLIDEIHSFKHKKKSLGTALDLGMKNISTVICYLLILIEVLYFLLK